MFQDVLVAKLTWAEFFIGEFMVGSIFYGKI
jgi:hypothetical protein